MSIMYSKDPFDTAEVIDLVLRERATSLSSREWKHRLAGYGYAIKDTQQGQVVETLRQGQEICVLPAEVAASA